MTLYDNDVPLIKSWLVKRVADLSDAEPEVLADYIIALLNNRIEGDELVKLLASQLSDFLEDSAKFSQEITEALSKRSFDTINEEEKRKLLNPEERKKSTKQAAINLTNTVYKPDKTSYRVASTDHRKSSRAHSNHRLNVVSRDSQNELEAKRQNQEHLETIISRSEVPRSRELIIANLPVDKLQEIIIKSYFSRFGEISKVIVSFDDRIAEVEFSDPKSAKRAWASPNPIFNNRFIKVFFKKQAEEKETEPEPLDIEAFKLKQLEKQKEFELKQARKKEFDAKLTQLIQLKENMLANFEKELAQLEEQLKSDPTTEDQVKVKVDSIRNQMIVNGVTPEQIAADKAKLEGKITTYAVRGRGGARGRGSTRGGRGGGRGGYAPYQKSEPATYNRKLDLRSRTITLKNAASDLGGDHIVETLGKDYVENIVPKGDVDLNVTFKDRYHAERFFSEEFKVGEKFFEKEWDEAVRPNLPATETHDDDTVISNDSNTASLNHESDANDVEVGL